MAEFGGKVLEMEAWSVRTMYTHIVLTHASNMAITMEVIATGLHEC